MGSLTFHPLLQVAPEEVSSVREALDLDERKIHESIDAIVEWWKKQEHLVEVLPHMKREMIERCLVLSRGSVENCKRRIEKLLTTRGLLPEMTLNKRFEEFDDFLDNVFVLPLSRSNPADCTRVSLMNFTTEGYQDFNLLVCIRFIILLADLRLFFDYKFGDRYILDLKNFKANMMTKLNPIDIRKTLTLFMDSYGIKVKSIHLINAPKFVDKFVNLIKQGLKEKIANRIYINSSNEELFAAISKEVLPEDYGGDEPSCRELLVKWREFFKTEEAQQVLDVTNKLFSNETRRSSIQFNEEYLGMPGSFKQLNID